MLGAQWWVDELVALEAPEVQLEAVEFLWEFRVRASWSHQQMGLMAS